MLLCILLPLQASSKIKNKDGDGDGDVDKHKENFSRVCMKVKVGTGFSGTFQISITEPDGFTSNTKSQSDILPNKKKCLQISPYWRDKKEARVMLKALFGKTVKCGTLSDEELSEKGKTINFCASGTSQFIRCRRC